MKIIIIDDEGDALSNFLIGIVDKAGIEYKMFRNDPAAAIEYLRKNRADAAFLDIQMPQINGIELAQRLIEVLSEIKIVFITGYTQDEKEIKNKFKNNLIGFCYKPYKYETLYGFIKQISDEIGDNRKVFLRTFGAFELLVENKPVKFTSAKSKELLALLTDKNGAYISMSETIGFLWPDKDLELAKGLYRDAVWRLRETLYGYGLKKLVVFLRAQLGINTDEVECDYWDFLHNRNREFYGDSYMPSYEWTLETQNMLDVIKQKSNG